MIGATMRQPDKQISNRGKEPSTVTLAKSVHGKIRRDAATERSRIPCVTFAKRFRKESKHTPLACSVSSQNLEMVEEVPCNIWICDLGMLV